LSASDVLRAAEEEEALAKATVQVERPLDQENDAGNMLGREENQLEVDLIKDKDQREEYLKSLARQNTQLLLNELFVLPTERVEDVTCAKMPLPTFKLPREKPVPKPKPPTKWEQYAKSKGIVKSKTKGAGKNPRVVWDDTVQDWVPNYGYKKAKADEVKNWMMHAKTQDPMEDPYAKAIEDKRERVAKNELQRLRNIARAQKVKVPGVGLAPPVAIKAGAASKAGGGAAKQSKGELEKAADLAKKSTASLGKFQEKLANSKLEQKAASSKVKGVKRKFDPLVSKDGSEKARNLKVLDNLMNKKPKLDVNKAVGHQIHAEDSNRRAEKAAAGKKGGGRKGGKGGGGKRTGKAHFKNRGGGKAKGGKSGGSKSKR